MKRIYLSRGTKNSYLIPLLVASLLILGVVAYAALNDTEFRSKAANNAKCMLPTQSLPSGKLSCKNGFSLNSSNLCCPSTTKNTPIPTRRATSCTPRPACLDAIPPCAIKAAPGTVFCSK